MFVENRSKNSCTLFLNRETEIYQLNRLKKQHGTKYTYYCQTTVGMLTDIWIYSMYLRLLCRWQTTAADM